MTALVTAMELMTRRRTPLLLVIFDCDGVLVDSEPVSNRVLAEDLTARGWTMTTAEATQRFLGTTLRDIQPAIEARLGAGLPADWQQDITLRIVQALREESTAIPGALEALRAVTALGVPWRIASNSSHAEMRAKFARLGISALVEGRLHSHTDVAAGKPAPDLFLAAAAAQGVPPDACVVVEDSLPGIRGAVAAGMDCLAYAPHSDPGHADWTVLRALGAVPFASMHDLPGLIAAGWRRAA